MLCPGLARTKGNQALVLAIRDVIRIHKKTNYLKQLRMQLSGLVMKLRCPFGEV